MAGQLLFNYLFTWQHLKVDPGDHWISDLINFLNTFEEKSAMQFEWKGVFPALLTPFDVDIELDTALFEHNLLAQQQAGVSGVIIGGSLGEASTLRDAEKEAMVKIAADCLNGSVPVVLNIAEASTKEAVHQARQARRWGADALMLLPPMRYRSDERETVVFFQTVASSIDLPVMLYNNPVDYRVEITPSMFEELVGCENIQAVKESTRDTSNVTRMINRFGNRFKILCGVDTIALEELMMGADGWVAGLVDAFPHETVAIFRLAKAGRLKEAKQLFRWFLPLLELDLHPKLVQYIKLAASKVGLGNEYVRPPRLILAEPERSRVLEIISSCLVTRPALPDYLSIPA